MEQSIVFGPEIPDRDLDREVSKIDDRLGEVDETIQPQVDSSAMDGVGSGMSDGRGDAGGGGGVGSAAAAGGLASKIPKPMAGTMAAKALPIAIAGSVGLGILSAAGKVSAVASATNSMFGTAMSLFFRPFGNFLGETLRPFARSALDMAVNFNRIAQKDGLGVAIVSVGSKAVKTWATAVGSAVGDLVGGEGDASDAVTLGVTALTANALRKRLPSIGIGSVLSGMGSGTLASRLGTIGMGSLVNPLTGSLVALLGGIISLGDLVDGDISSWNLPAKFGHALGEGFQNAWPGMAEDIRKFFEDNIFAELGEATREVVEGEGDAAVEEESGNRELSPDLETGFIDPRGIPGLRQAYEFGQNFQRGGVVSGGPVNAQVAESGPEVVQPLSDFERTIEQVANAASQGGGGEMDTAGLERKLDTLIRLMRDFNRSDDGATIEVDGERLGRVVTDSKQNRVADTNPMI